MKRLKRYTVAGILFVLITGTISHFIYKWSGNNPIAGIFFPVNESTWEHMKLCFFPMLLYSIFMNRQLRHDYPCVTHALLSGVLLGTLLIPVLFYTYSGILGYHSLPLDIATFVLSVLISFFAVYRLSLSCGADSAGFLLKLFTILLLLGFLLFTFYPPQIGIFNDPAALAGNRKEIH